jgi:hypothetical protein
MIKVSKDIIQRGHIIGVEPAFDVNGKRIRDMYNPARYALDIHGQRVEHWRGGQVLSYGEAFAMARQVGL